MSDEGSTKTSGTCAGCQVSTKIRCSACLDGPLYDDCIPKPSFYCSTACQKAGWGQHKSVCRALQARKSLFRARQLLQAIVYRIQLHVSPYRSKRVRVDGSAVILEHDKPSHYEWERQLERFPVCLKDNQGLFEAGLVFGSGTEAMIYLHGFSKELLKGEPHTSHYSFRTEDSLLNPTELCPKIEEVIVTLNEPKLRLSVRVQKGNVRFAHSNISTTRKEQQ